MVEGVKNVVSAVGEVVDRLTLPAREKKQLETDLLKVFIFLPEYFSRWDLMLFSRRWQMIS